MKSYVFALMASTGLLAQNAFALQQVSGSGARGAVSQSIAVGNASALLSSFDFNYGIGNDHMLTLVRALPFEDNSLMYAAYSDKNSDDSYSYAIGFEPVLDAGIIEREATGQCRNRCTSTVSVPVGYTFILRGFETRFSDSDHNIKTLGVELSGSVLSVYMADKNGDDLFTYRVRYALVPNALVAQVSQSSGSGVAAGAATIPTGKIVLRGFMLNYASTDHHISRIAVKPQNGSMKVNFHDKNADDSISWRVQWAKLR